MIIPILFIWAFLVLLICLFVYGAYKVQNNPKEPDESSSEGRHKYTYPDDDVIF